ncbi:Fasciclin-like arabinogalactan protein [Podospora conica]|nr:Fasciclin-like arabinogalactan protein [Schizothecium conicum]
MHRKHLLLPLLAIRPAAPQSLANILASQNDTLSVLNSFLSQEQAFLETVANTSDITVLAPSNAALSSLPQSVVDRVDSDPHFLGALLNYHVLNGTYYAAGLATGGPHQLLRTLLADAPPYAAVPGGQRVVAAADGADGSVSLRSGLQRTARVQLADYNFTGGTVHIVDSLLTVPANLSETLLVGGYTAAVGALRQGGLADVLDADGAPLTVLVPSNAGFAAVGSLVADMSAEDLQLVLGYHVVQGRALYAAMLADGEGVQTLQGGDVTFRREDGGVFVNGARVLVEDVLVANGVVHIIDNILNPLSPKATPDPTLSTQPPAFSGASSTGGIPFTTGVTVPPTDPATSLTPTTRTSSASPDITGAAAPMKTGAAGVAAMVGGAAAMWNL